VRKRRPVGAVTISPSTATDVVRLNEGATVDRTQFLPTPENPYDPEDRQRHAGKVFVIPHVALVGGAVQASDESDPLVLKDRLLLCLWDLTAGTSIWLPIQSEGEYVTPHEANLLLGGQDPNWMNPARISRHRNGTLWRLGRPGRPFAFYQREQRAVRLPELELIRSRISESSLKSLLPSAVNPE
jgi:hypothetical protein